MVRVALLLSVCAPQVHGLARRSTQDPVNEWANFGTDLLSQNSAVKLGTSFSGTDSDGSSAITGTNQDTSPPSVADTTAPIVESNAQDKDAYAFVDASQATADAASLGAVVNANGRVTLQSGGGGADQFTAFGSMQDQLDSTGWIGLSVKISEGADLQDGQKMYAAGVVEGFLSAERIREFHDNSKALSAMDPANRARRPKLEEGLAGMVSHLQESSKSMSDAASDNFGAQVSNAFMQTWGIRDGYAAAISKSQKLQGAGAEPLSMVDMFILNSDGVLDELLTAYGGEAAPPPTLLEKSVKHVLRGGKRGAQHANATHTTPAPRAGPQMSFVAHAHAAMLQDTTNADAEHTTPAPRAGPQMSFKGHCTGLVRLADNNQELYFGHTTWESFSEMTRMWKVYDFPLKGATAKKISMSSYPGCVSSTDDYYLMDSGLAVTETTLSIPRKIDYQVSGQVPDFIRIMAANRGASTAEDWVESMSNSATNTYSSQWMVLDYKKFKPGEDLQDGTFMVLEQAPGSSTYKDRSSWLQGKRYWSSYDRAVFDETRAVTGDDEAMTGSAAVKDIYSKDDTPRAQIVRATETGINSLDSMRSEMSRNSGGKTDLDVPQLETPRFDISARDDVTSDGAKNDKGTPEGGVDGKVTSSCLFQQMSAQAISSPSHSNLPAFKWTEGGQDTWSGYPHEGLPDEANFDWQSMSASDSVVGPLSSGGCQ